jgi:hypothetical protein
MKFQDIIFDFGVYRYVQTRNFNLRQPKKKSRLLGYGWKTNAVACCLIKTRNGYKLRLTAGKGLRFKMNPTNGDYHALKEPCSQLTVKETSYEIIREDQSVWLFDQDKNGTGQLQQIQCPDGRVMLFCYDNENRLITINAYEDRICNKLYGSVTFHYETNHKLSKIIVVIADQNGILGNFAKVYYDYYREGDFYGNAHDLKTVTLFSGKEQRWETLGSYYYRYYRENEQQGYQHAMKFAFSPEKFAELESIFGTEIFAVPDTEVMSMASHYFEYDEHKRIVLERISFGREVTKQTTWAKFDGIILYTA